jgi:RecJ-like exonuclease
VYNAFKSKLTDHGAFIAACSAVTDYMEDRPIGSKLLQKFDRQFVLLEATVLTFTIVSHQKDSEYLLYLVDELSESKYPHDIPNSFEFARIQAEKISNVIQKVKDNLKLMKNLAYMEVTDSGASMVVNFVLGMSGKDVGVSYKLREDHGIYAVSIRGSRSCKIHLGKIVNPLATELGGSGGGHDKACGAVIPKDKISVFLKKFNSKLK